MLFYNQAPALSQVINVYTDNPQVIKVYTDKHIINVYEGIQIVPFRREVIHNALTLKQHVFFRLLVQATRTGTIKKLLRVTVE